VPSDRRTATPDLDDRVVRTALMSLPFASVLLVDRDLRYRTAVGKAISYYGFEPSKMIGRLVSDTLSPETYAFVEPALRRALAGETFTEIREIGPLGGVAFEMAYGPAIDDGEIVGALVVVRDVSVEQRALAGLAASDELYQMLMSLTSDVITLTNPVDSRYTWVSPSARQVVGWRHDELVGRFAENYVHPDDLPALRTAWRSLMDLARRPNPRGARRRRHGDPASVDVA
jgi:PAS domain S-box-containing protein